MDVTDDGVLAAPATALTKNGDVNPEAVDGYVKFLTENGVDGVFILGTLGEGMSLTVKERQAVTEAWVKYGKGRLKTVIAHVGAGNLRDSIELAQHAGKAGVTAIACMSPSYFKPATEEIMVDYLQQVAAAAPDTPFYYYCINFMTGVNLNTARVLELARDKIPTLRGAKISSRELPNMLDCVQLKDMHIMMGTDEQFLSCLTLGIRVPILNSYVGTTFRKLREAYDRGDLATAREQMVTARKLVLINRNYGGGPAVVKAIMKCLGVDLGPVRLPLTAVPEDRLTALSQELKALGLPTVN